MGIEYGSPTYSPQAALQIRPAATFENYVKTTEVSQQYMRLGLSVVIEPRATREQPTITCVDLFHQTVGRPWY
jgi:hypothetical protein